MFKKHTQFLLTLLLLVVFVQSAPAQHEIDLTGNVPVYGQQQCIWCGAASAQMIMDGYPDPAHRVLHTQLDIWNTIQANNSNDPADVGVGWATDPIGLREALMLRNPPPGGTWSIHEDANRDTVMFDIMYWMNRNNYPVATLINQGGHWVVITGYESDIEPVAGSTPVLQHITRNDPEPHNVGTQSTVDAATWFATDWVGPVQYAGTWLNDYVAVIEPPVKKGKVKVEKIVRTGDKIISPERAVKNAIAAIDEFKFGAKPRYGILRKRGVSNFEPILVGEHIKHRSRKDKVPQYYIVPFGFEKEVSDCDVRFARVCVIVNAYTGRFEEIGAFGKPVKYLLKKEAINIITRNLRLKTKQMRNIKAELMFQPGDITHIRLYPFWKVAVADRTLYVDQLGKIYTSLKPSIPGD